MVLVHKRFLANKQSSLYVTINSGSSAQLNTTVGAVAGILTQMDSLMQLMQLQLMVPAVKLWRLYFF
jgi:hypothetical protein